MNRQSLKDNLFSYQMARRNRQRANREWGQWRDELARTEMRQATARMNKARARLRKDMVAVHRDLWERGLTQVAPRV